MRVLRSSSCTPSCASSWRIWALSAGCAMPSVSAARVKLSCSATARKYRSSLASGPMSGW